MKLLTEVLAALKIEGLGASEEHPPPYDSLASSAVEAAVKQVRSRMKTLKMCFKRRIGKRIPPGTPSLHGLMPIALQFANSECEESMARHPMSESG